MVVIKELVSSFVCIMSQRRPLTKKLLIDFHILSFCLSVQISKRCGMLPTSNVSCMKNYRRHHSPGRINADNMASCFLLLFLIISYFLLPFVSSSSFERFNDDFENSNSTEGFISHMSRSQLGYSASQATSPTVMSNRQNDFNDRDNSHHRTPASTKNER